LPEIATDYLNQTRPNVLFGGGGKGISISSAEHAGYTVVTDRAEMQLLDSDNITMVSGQFGNTNLPYEYDGLGSLPHLSEMTSKAIEFLDNDPDGFFLMVEGGKIDHAGHANDTVRNVFETVEFSNAVEVAVDWAQEHLDTIIIVTADHETGGLTVLQNNGQDNFPTVFWSTTGHTGENVPIYAWGENADLVYGIMDNTDLFELVIADTRAPTILFTDPSDDTMDAPVRYEITATFSEAMDASTITTETFLVNDGSVDIVGEVTYNGTAATFIPTTNLDYDTNYVVCHRSRAGYHPTCGSLDQSGQ
jgi:alkaline phosphatase